MPAEILTIGHSVLPIERFIELLRDNGVDVLVDVRSTPYSRYNPQFTCACATGAGNRESLAASLAAAGIEYAFAGDYLGGRPRDPTCYRNGELPGEGADYLKLVDYQEVMRRPWYQRTGENAMVLLTERIVEKLQQLPEPDLREVLNFVEFLMWRTTEQKEPLLAVMGILSGKMLSAEEIERELYGDGDEA
jgi:hypothetical protein